MKKTIFAGISLLSISICIDEVWGPPVRSHSMSDIRRGVSRQGSVSRYNNRGGASRQGSTVSNSQNRPNSTGNMNVQSTTNVRPESVKSFLESVLIERSASDDLKKIIDEVPSEHIKILQRNMENFNTFLSGNRDEDAKNVANKLKRAIACLGELITTRNVICSQLQYEMRKDKNLSNSVVSLSEINKDLSKINMQKLSEIISICENEKTLGILGTFTEDLKKFSNRIKDLKDILKKMNETFSPVVLGQIEGNPEFKNLEFANTPANRRLAKIRDDEEEKNDSSDFQIVSAQQNTVQTADVNNPNITTPGSSGQPQDTSQTETENSSNNATNSQPTPVQQSVGQTTTESSTANAAVTQVASVPQNTVQTTDVSNSNATTLGSSGQSQNTGQQPVGDNSSQVPTQQPANSAAPQGQNSGIEGSAGNAAVPQGITTQSTENNINNAPIPQGNSSNNATDSQSTSTQTGQQSATGDNSGNVAPQPTPVQQSVGQSGTESNAGNGTNSQPAPAQTGQHSVTEGNLGNAVSQSTPVQQSVGQTTTESSPAGVTVSTPQNTIQTTDVSNSNATTSESLGQLQNTSQTETGNSSNNANSQGSLTQQPANSAAPQGQNSGIEGSAGNAAVPQGITTQSTENNINNAPIPQGNSSNNATDSQSTSVQQSVGLPTTASNFQVNTINREDPKKFYALLEQNIGLLKEEDFNDEKKKAVLNYLNEAISNCEDENNTSRRRFAQRVSDVPKVIKAYNSLAILIPKKLNTVPRQKIKSLREAIYSDVFDDLTSSMEKLKADNKFKNYEKDINNAIGVNERNKSDFFDNSFFNAFFNKIKDNQEINFAEFLESQEKKTDSFTAITSDRKDRAGRSDQFSSALLYDEKKAKAVIGIYRRGLMSSSVEEYDQLIRKIKKETGEKLDLAGPDLHDGVILSIDVN